jgi:hypothetical protein
LAGEGHQKRLEEQHARTAQKAQRHGKAARTDNSKAGTYPEVKNARPKVASTNNTSFKSTEGGSATTLYAACYNCGKIGDLSRDFWSTRDEMPRENYMGGRQKQQIQNGYRITMYDREFRPGEKTPWTRPGLRV